MQITLTSGLSSSRADGRRRLGGRHAPERVRVAQLDDVVVDAQVDGRRGAAGEHHVVVAGELQLSRPVAADVGVAQQPGDRRARHDVEAAGAGERRAGQRSGAEDDDVVRAERIGLGTDEVVDDARVDGASAEVLVGVVVGGPRASRARREVDEEDAAAAQEGHRLPRPGCGAAAPRRRRRREVAAQPRRGGGAGAPLRRHEVERLVGQTLTQVGSPPHRSHFWATPSCGSTDGAPNGQADDAGAAAETASWCRRRRRPSSSSRDSAVAGQRSVAQRLLALVADDWDGARPDRRSRRARRRSVR